MSADTDAELRALVTAASSVRSSHAAHASRYRSAGASGRRGAATIGAKAMLDELRP